MMSKKVILATLAIPFLIACSKSYVEVEPGSENVTVANTIDQSSCTLKAQVKVRMTGYAERRDNYTELDHIQLAKNAAVEQGGNTIYQINHPEAGKGTQSSVYQIYSCS